MHEGTHFRSLPPLPLLDGRPGLEEDSAGSSLGPADAADDAAPNRSVSCDSRAPSFAICYAAWKQILPASARQKNSGRF